MFLKFVLFCLYLLAMKIKLSNPMLLILCYLTKNSSFCCSPFVLLRLLVQTKDCSLNLLLRLFLIVQFIQSNLDLICYKPVHFLQIRAQLKLQKHSQEHNSRNVTAFLQILSQYLFLPPHNV